MIVFSRLVDCSDSSPACERPTRSSTDVLNTSSASNCIPERAASYASSYDDCMNAIASGPLTPFGRDLPIGRSARLTAARLNCSVPLSLAELIRSEEHTSELQSLMRISYAVFCMKKKKKNNETRNL